jgi:hypothetical protein
MYLLRYMYTETRQPVHENLDNGGGMYLRNVDSVAHNYTRIAKCLHQ